MDAVFDLLVIGGGINGAGIARDAAMRGLRVCLVEKEDYGWGTSSKSSMLAHGGLRYLEQFELGLVHEALQDREMMFRQAPHLVRPLRFIYPLYPHIASRRTVRAGLFLYDVLSHGKSVPKRDHLGRDEVVAALPGIRTDGLHGGAAYYDGQWNSVERFVAELVLDARAHGAVCLPHTRVVALRREDGRCRGATVAADPDVDEAMDLVAGLGGQDGVVDIEARATINASGPWVDDVLRGAVRSPRLIRGTKGIHIVVPRFVDTALIIRAKDGRTFFILPWHGHCIVGTTDTDFEGDPGDATATAEEVAYLQESARWYFPDAPLDDVQWTYAGVRPLVNEEGLTEGHVTRRHVLHDHRKDGTERLWSVQGGKLTTYRHLAEEAVDEVVAALDVPDARHHPTRRATLPGGIAGEWRPFRDDAVDVAQEQGIPQEDAVHLVETYGARWKDVAAHGGDDRWERVPGTRHLWCEVANAVLEEQAFCVADVMLRRTQMGLADDDRPAAARKVAKRMASLLGWDRSRIRAELRRYALQRARLTVPRPAG